jgi:hypothetical protein
LVEVGAEFEAGVHPEIVRESVSVAWDTGQKKRSGGYQYEFILHIKFPLFFGMRTVAHYRARPFGSEVQQENASVSAWLRCRFRLQLISSQRVCRIKCGVTGRSWLLQCFALQRAEESHVEQGPRVTYSATVQVALSVRAYPCVMHARQGQADLRRKPSRSSASSQSKVVLM